MTEDVETSSQIIEAAEQAAIDLDALVKRVDNLLSAELYWFPVRHHSPTIARHVGAVIRQRQPKVVFIEGPAEAQGMIEFLIDAKTRPPVAIYSSYKEDRPPDAPPDFAPRRHAMWYPLVSYSPEYRAMNAANAVGAKTVFMDLPHYARAQADSPPMDLERIAQRSSFYRALTRAAGFRTFDETWDRLFETPARSADTETLRREVAIFCAAVRETTPRASLQSDDTLPRERFMWWTIQQTLKDLKLKPHDAMIVCGGFHIFLDQADTTPPPPIPTGTLSVTVAPYSYFRISQLSGYGAGNRAPRFYELCYDHHCAGVGQDQVVIDYVIDVVKETRRRGTQLSSADAIGATQHALLLARLRGKADPVLDDIHDALISCCCKGNPRTDATDLLEAIDYVNIGVKLGRVTDKLGRLPVVNDFYEQLQRLDLEDVAAHEKVVNLALDKRQPLDLARSAFLHRLVFLDVPIGTVQRESSPFGQSIFKEHWRLQWSPKIEAGLIERNLHGDTVEAAAATLLRESLGTNANEAGAACRRLVQAVDMDLPQLITDAEAAAGPAIDHDDRFHSLADALTSLLLLERYAAYRHLGKDKLTGLIDRCFDRACFAVPEVACAPPEEWDNVISALLALAEPVVQRPDLDADLFAAHVQQAASVSTMPFLRGAFLGVLTEMRRMKADDLAKELLGYARGSTDQQVVAGDFLHGVLRVSRTAVLLGAKSLVAAVDELLRVADHEIFLGMVPRLRAAFETLHDAQRDSIAVNVAELYGLKESESLRELSTSVGTAALMELDNEVAKIMKEWMG